MLKSFIIVAALAFVTTGAAIVSVSASDSNHDIVSRVVDLHDITPPPMKPEKIIPPPPPKQSIAKPTLKFTTPVVEEDDKILDEPPTQDQLAKTGAGNADNAKGDPDGLLRGVDTASGTGIVELPAPPNIFVYVEQAPAPPYDIYSYLGKHIKYPSAARENNIEGRIMVKFVVNEDGKITNAEVAGSKRFGGGLEEEALRVVGALPTWNPGKQNGRAVKVYYTLPVQFRLE